MPVSPVSTPMIPVAFAGPNLVVIALLCSPPSSHQYRSLQALSTRIRTGPLLPPSRSTQLSAQDPSVVEPEDMGPETVWEVSSVELYRGTPDSGLGDGGCETDGGVASDVRSDLGRL